MQNKAFTLIELLVVIVIIGVLSTISTATFNGYFAKARDIERQTFVQSASRIIIASQLAEDTKDYNLTESEIVSLLEENGLSVPGVKNNIVYRYIRGGDSLEFVFFACKEDAIGTTSTDIFDIAFIAGDYDDLQSNVVHISGAQDVCGGPFSFAGPGVVDSGNYPFLGSGIIIN